ncbi:MAG: hypothetical protein KDA80_20475, partial [Planctomycetaceae bacterium]|nr:hypothetical protein [Planctomycetaceae bacterium]
MPTAAARHSSNGLLFSARSIFHRFLRGWTRRQHARQQVKRQTSGELLEDRTLLAAFTVDTTADTVAADGKTSLREAIASANANADLDTISFDSSLAGQTITLSSGVLSITNDVDIQGLGGGKLTVDGNSQSQIFDIASGSTVSISHLTLTGGIAKIGSAFDNTATGGAIHNEGDLTLADMELTGNHAVSDGGAIFSESGSTISLERVTIAGNTSDLSGAGLAAYGPATIVNTTVSGNSAKNDAGGILIRNPALITNTTITGNRSDSDGNSPNRGGGIRNGGGAVLTLHNSIVAGNLDGTGSTASDIVNVGTIASAKNNVIGDAATSAGINDGTDGNIVGVGGTGTRAIGTILDPTLMVTDGVRLHRLVNGSPALNAGSNALSVDANSSRLQFDQRGGPFVRVSEGTVDIGAYEFINFSVNTLADETTNPDTVSLREAIAVANATPGFDNIFSLPSGKITLTQGLMSITQDLQLSGPGADVLTIDGNSQSQIFDIAAGSTVSMSGLTLTGGNAKIGFGFDKTATGGAIHNEGNLTLTDVELTGNHAVSDGGAIFSELGSSLSLERVTIAGNTSDLSGAGLAAYAPATIVNSTISGNAAKHEGGGLLLTAKTTITNSTIAFNRADADGNASGNGGGVWSDSTITIQNSIIAGNIRGTGSTSDELNLTGTTTSKNNVVGSASTTLDMSLADHGGPTRTHALLPGSPA